MTFYFNSESPSYRETIRLARSEHACLSCKEVIFPNEFYVDCSGRYGDNPFSAKICGLCAEARIKIYQHELDSGIEQNEWPSLCQIGAYCKSEGFPMGSYKEGQKYLEELRRIQELEKRRLKEENRKKEGKNV